MALAGGEALDNVTSTMNLVSLNIESIQLGHPLPFVLRGSDGVLLAQKGYVIRTREELAKMVARGRQLCVDTDESGESHRAYLAQLQRMLIADTNLGEIAAMKMTAADDAGGRGRTGKTLPDWPELQLRATQLLRAPSPADFGGRFQTLHDELARHCEQTPDATLLGLIYLSAQETRMYSATHSMLVSCVCMVVAREMLRWPAGRVQQVGHAALSMNIAMTELQDQLAQQKPPPDKHQLADIHQHPHRGRDILHGLGVGHDRWLNLVADSHESVEGGGYPTGKRAEGLDLMLLQLSDRFVARISPRQGRKGLSARAAVRAHYLEMQRQNSPLGALLVKHLGMYLPGSYVRLQSNEIAVVTRSTPALNAPMVMAIIGKDGIPLSSPSLRDTATPTFAIQDSVASDEVKVRLDPSRLFGRS